MPITRGVGFPGVRSEAAAVLWHACPGLPWSQGYWATCMVPPIWGGPIDHLLLLLLPGATGAAKRGEF